MEWHQQSICKVQSSMMTTLAFTIFNRKLQECYKLFGYTMIMFSLFVAHSTKLKTKMTHQHFTNKKFENNNNNNENYDKFKTNQFTNFQGIEMKIQLFSTNCPSTLVHLYFSQLIQKKYSAYIFVLDKGIIKKLGLGGKN